MFNLKIEKIFSMLDYHLRVYPSPTGLTYAWNGGSIAGLFLIIQILSGIFLAMHYCPNIVIAFDSVEHIMRDVYMGWLLRYMHANGASFFFFIMYLHIARGLFYRSFLSDLIGPWVSGMAIYLIAMATGFLGYVLPWGQMSFWGATVITNLFSILPFVGETLVHWLWGGFSVGGATLTRFFSLHYLLPFLAAALSLLHLLKLHEQGSSTPFSFNPHKTLFFKTFFYYFWVKDLMGVYFILIIYIYIIGYEPNLLGHSDNYIEANPLSTPEHIVPEWYFLPMYAILRAIPNKALGVLGLFSSLIILLILPIKAKLYRSFIFFRYLKSIYVVHNLSNFLIFLFIFNFILLGWLGGQPAEEPYVLISQCASFCHYFFLTNLILFSHFYFNPREN